jgi:hypothetical protein
VKGESYHHVELKLVKRLYQRALQKKTYETELFKMYFQNFSFDLTRYLVNARSNHEFQDLTVTNYDTKKRVGLRLSYFSWLHLLTIEHA